MPQRLLDYAFQIFDLKMRATAFKLFWEVANSRQACVEQLKMAIGSPKKKRCDQSEYKERASWYSAEYKIATENIVPESYEINSSSITNCKVAKSIESRSDRHSGAVKEAEVVLPREGTKEYRAEYKKVLSPP